MRSERRPGAYGGGDGSLLSSDERLGSVSRSDRRPRANSGSSLAHFGVHDRGHATSSEEKLSDVEASNVEAIEPVCTQVGGAGSRPHSEQPQDASVTRMAQSASLGSSLGSFAENGRQRTVAKPRQAPKSTSSGSRYYAELVRRQRSDGCSPDAPSTPITPVSVPQFLRIGSSSS